MAKERRLNQFGTTAAKTSEGQQSLSHYSTLQWHVIRTAFLLSAEPNASGASSENIVQNHSNIALLNVI